MDQMNKITATVHPFMEFNLTDKICTFQARRAYSYHIGRTVTGAQLKPETQQVCLFNVLLSTCIITGPVKSMRCRSSALIILSSRNVPGYWLWRFYANSSNKVILSCLVVISLSYADIPFVRYEIIRFQSMSFAYRSANYCNYMYCANAL